MQTTNQDLQTNLKKILGLAEQIVQAAQEAREKLAELAAHTKPASRAASVEEALQAQLSEEIDLTKGKLDEIREKIKEADKVIFKVDELRPQSSLHISRKLDLGPSMIPKGYIPTTFPTMKVHSWFYRWHNNYPNGSYHEYMAKALDGKDKAFGWGRSPREAEENAIKNLTSSETGSGSG